MTYVANKKKKQNELHDSFSLTHGYLTKLCGHWSFIFPVNVQFRGPGLYKKKGALF